jgi:hypothetical protein
MFFDGFLVAENESGGQSWLSLHNFEKNGVKEVKNDDF